MRRVYDDTLYDDISDEIMDILKSLSFTPQLVQEYSHGGDGSSSKKIKDFILGKMAYSIKFGRNVNTTGIGNNAAYEVITIQENEEQILGILHLTNNMFGRHICWMSDIDGERRYKSIKI